MGVTEAQTAAWKWDWTKSLCSLLLTDQGWKPARPACADSSRPLCCVLSSWVWGGTLRGEGLGTRNGKDGSENVFVANTMRERPGKGPALGRERAVNRAGGQREIPSVTTEAEGVTGAPRAEAGCIRRNIPVCLCCPTYAAFLSNKLTAFVLERLG